MKSFDSFVALSQTLLQILESRLELLGVEYRLEKARASALAGFVCVAASSFILAGVAFTVALAFAVPAEYRASVMVLAAVAYLGILAGCLGAIYRLLSSQRTPFIETRQELQKDAECLASALSKKK